MASIVPAGGWAYGLQLPVQTLTRLQVDPWEGGATVMHLKFRAGTLPECLEQFGAFADSVVPLVNAA